MTALTAPQKPMAFYHSDGHIPAWNFATRYAGPEGHVATLPEIIEARLATKPGDLPWERYFTTATAEYYGKGADGREKLIIAHGVGPMSTIEGIKQAYSWEYKDGERKRRGGRISADEFLQLEAGKYGKATVLESITQFMELNSADRHLVFVIDFGVYLEWAGEHALRIRHRAITAVFDLLLLARLGTSGPEYIAKHRKCALRWHKEGSIRLDTKRGPYIIFNGDAGNCPYTTFEKVDGRYDWASPQPRPLEEGKAVGHLISIGGLAHMHSSDDWGPWEGLTCEVSCHEWRDGVRFLGVPQSVGWSDGIDEASQPHDVLRRRWQDFMQPVDDATVASVAPRLCRIEQSGDEWFTRYPKQSDGPRMDESDIEFNVRAIRAVGEPGQFKVDEDFFLRYSLSQVIAIAPDDANAYDITDISRPDGEGLTTVTVQFYQADVDMSRRLPRANEVKQNYDLMMG